MKLSFPANLITLTSQMTLLKGIIVWEKMMKKSHWRWRQMKIDFFWSQLIQENIAKRKHELNHIESTLVSRTGLNSSQNSMKNHFCFISKCHRRFSFSFWFYPLQIDFPPSSFFPLFQLFYRRTVDFPFVRLPLFRLFGATESIWAD